MAIFRDFYDGEIFVRKGNRGKYHLVERIQGVWFFTACGEEIDYTKERVRVVGEKEAEKNICRRCAAKLQGEPVPSAEEEETEIEAEEPSE